MGDLYAPVGQAGTALTIRSPRIEAVAWWNEQVAASPASATSWPRPEPRFQAQVQARCETGNEIR
jgi:hypothetical protein